MNRSERLEARTTPEIMAFVKRAAQMQGRSVSDFVMGAAEREAQRTIEETQIIRLSAEDQVAFASALLNDQGPNEAMQRAIERRKQLLGENK